MFRKGVCGVAEQEEKLVIPKSDTEAGPGLIQLEEGLHEETNPLLTFNEHD